MSSGTNIPIARKRTRPRAASCRRLPTLFLRSRVGGLVHGGQNLRENPAPVLFDDNRLRWAGTRTRKELLNCRPIPVLDFGNVSLFIEHVNPGSGSRAFRVRNTPSWIDPNAQALFSVFVVTH